MLWKNTDWKAVPRGTAKAQRAHGGPESIEGGGLDHTGCASFCHNQISFPKLYASVCAVCVPRMQV